MDSRHIVDGLIFYLGLVALLTFHEFAHAWVAWLCGDDTARLQGRMSLNPIVHIDPIGTVAFPLLMIFTPLGGMLVGWAKPVPVNPANLRNPIRDDVCIAMAGPAMNLMLAAVLMLFARLGVVFQSDQYIDVFLQMAWLSLLLCLFNLIPVPPLDGSHVLRNFIGMSWETYWNLCRFGIIPVFILMNIPGVQSALRAVTDRGLVDIATLFGPEMREITQQFIAF